MGGIPLQQADIMVTILSCHHHDNLPGADPPHSLAFGDEGPLPGDHAAVKSKNGRWMHVDTDTIVTEALWDDV
jgi:hypothetical protein